MFKFIITRFIKDERGVTAIEYGVIGVAIAVVIGAVMLGTGTDSGLAAAIGDSFDGILATLTGVNESIPTD
ncbi:Flp family type IVb pilin [Vibrio gallicus]|uniref:Flp family type IVb pilin n=1 Tax=Vibrio gallicus TaxID=190897 RepID=UPI0021C2C106|nr:Flp family type IVb pilin [Vibrio gallicus]